MANLILKWNDTVVLEAECTKVMAYDIVKMFAGNFGNVEKAASKPPALPPLMEIDCAEKGARFYNTWKDDTGKAYFQITI